MPRVLTAVLLASALALAACGDDAQEPGGATTSVTEAPVVPETTADRPAGLPEDCEAVQPPAPREDGGADEPEGKVAGGTRVRVETSCGAFEVALDAERAPRTARSFASLARQGFYDGTTFHRIVPGFVIQGGDPTATGTGGPGYSVQEEPPADLRYTAGVVAMAKSPSDPPGTSGSQFFVVTGEDAGLPPEYALVGEVVAGMDVVERIASAQVGAEDRPIAPIVIRTTEVVTG